MLRKILRIEKYSKMKPTLLKLNEIYNIGTKENTLLQSQFLHKELPIRLAHRTRELYQLPDSIINTRYLQNVYDLYASSFDRILDHPFPKCNKDILKFSELISDIKKKHSNLEIDIARSIEHEKYSCYQEYDCIKKQKIDEILTNFYMSRIGIRFLIGQHLSIINDYNKNDFRRGLIDKKCNPYLIAEEAICNIKHLSNLIHPDINIEYIIKGDKDINFLYIPSHLNFILFEIIKNSTQAIINLNSISSHQININIQKGEKDIIIKVSDSAGGFSRDISDKVFSFLYTSSNNKLETIINQDIVFSGYGHGLGLSRIYTNYLGGDINIISTEGVGTDVFIFLKIIDADEIISNYCI
ncbi:Mitochondrial branched-chain alpha-ketoacid dehydrogenase kinase [seawater metagenome]|uniref:[pyruvate dehydrogenase (acetyl-transferring)] kinase n=1 Tax=seawater metagenome TaxID=1561972 RepID=A0A5E8CJ77_9ZZZZ